MKSDFLLSFLFAFIAFIIVLVARKIKNSFASRQNNVEVYLSGGNMYVNIESDISKEELSNKIIERIKYEGSAVTYKVANKKRAMYFLLSAFFYTLGMLISFVTLIKSIYYSSYVGSVFSEPVRNIINTLYRDIPIISSIVRWFWPWMSIIKFDAPFSILLCPSLIVGFGLLAAAGVLFRNASRFSARLRMAELTGLGQLAGPHRQHVDGGAP